MMGEFVPEGTPKSGREFWEKVCKCGGNMKATSVSREIVKNSAMKIQMLDKYNDVVYCIYEVQNSFPTGFMMQELKKEPASETVLGACFAKITVRNWLKELRAKMKRLYTQVDYKDLQYFCNH